MRRGWIMPFVCLLGFIFLYAPILSLVIFSFNESKLVTVWGGFSTKWYGELMRDPQILGAAWISLQVGVISATLAVCLGTLVAYVLVRFTRFRGRPLLTAMSTAPLVMPEVITGLSLLLLFVSMQQLIGWPGSRGMLTIIIAHVTFCLAYVAVVVQSRLADMDRQGVARQVLVGVVPHGVALERIGLEQFQIAVHLVEPARQAGHEDRVREHALRAGLAVDIGARLGLQRRQVSPHAQLPPQGDHQRAYRHRMHIGIVVRRLEPCQADQGARVANHRIGDLFNQLLRAAGIEVLLDVVFNHTAESDECGPTICWICPGSRRRTRRHERRDAGAGEGGAGGKRGRDVAGRADGERRHGHERGGLPPSCVEQCLGGEHERAAPDAIQDRRPDAAALCARGHRGHRDRAGARVELRGPGGVEAGVVERALGDLLRFIRRQRNRNFPGLLFTRDNGICDAGSVLGVRLVITRRIDMHNVETLRQLHILNSAFRKTDLFVLAAVAGP